MKKICIFLTLFAFFMSAASDSGVEVIRIGPDTPNSGVKIDGGDKKKSWDTLDELRVDEITGVQDEMSEMNTQLELSKSKMPAYKVDDGFRDMLAKCSAGEKSVCAEALRFADKNSTQCNLNSTEVCRSYATIYIKYNQRQKALNARQIACNGNNATACFEAWNLYESGKGIKKNPKQGFSLLTRSCDFKNAEACYKLAGYYRTGVGAELNLKKAKELYSKSCDLGNSDACDAYNEFL